MPAKSPGLPPVSALCSLKFEVWCLGCSGGAINRATDGTKQTIGSGTDGEMASTAFAFPPPPINLSLFDWQLHQAKGSKVNKCWNNKAVIATWVDLQATPFTWMAKKYPKNLNTAFQATTKDRKKEVSPPQHRIDRIDPLDRIDPKGSHMDLENRFQWPIVEIVYNVNHGYCYCGVSSPRSLLQPPLTQTLQFHWLHCIENRRRSPPQQAQPPSQPLNIFIVA